MPFFNSECGNGSVQGGMPEEFRELQDAETRLCDRYSRYGDGNSTGLLMARELDQSMYSTMLYGEQREILNSDQVVYRYYERTKEGGRENRNASSSFPGRGRFIPRPQFLVVSPFRLWGSGGKPTLRCEPGVSIFVDEPHFRHNNHCISRAPELGRHTLPPTRTRSGLGPEEYTGRGATSGAPLASCIHQCDQ
jgi:hypothetical protein